MQIHVSKTLTADLKPHLAAEMPVDLRAMQWYGHRVQVLRRKCVILMEERSRYATVMTGLTKPDFARFSDLVRDRLWREAVAICQLDREASGRLAALAGVITEHIQIAPGSDRSVQAHINDVAWHLESIAAEAGSLPADSGDEFAFGLRVNQMPRKRSGEKDFFVPLEVIREFWLGLLDHMQPRSENVIPFRRPPKI